jgi:hypothetical protein
MRVTYTAALAAFVLTFFAVSAGAADAACSLLTQDQVGVALGISVNAGTPISGPTTCQWMGQGKWATLTITQPLGGKTAIDRYNSGKASSLPGITKEPVAEVGDDAFYVYFTGTTRAGLGLVVKKGSSAFEVRVYGLDVEKAKPVAKTLAQNVAGKL